MYNKHQPNLFTGSSNLFIDLLEYLLPVWDIPISEPFDETVVEVCKFKMSSPELPEGDFGEHTMDVDGDIFGVFVSG